MATSLARQLAALRTPATQALSADGGYYNGPFLFTEADQKHCDMHQLKDKMIESLDALIELEPAFDRYKDFLTHERYLT